MFSIQPETKPIGFRERLAYFLVRLAKKIKPENEAVTCFWLEEVAKDAMIYGTGFMQNIQYKDVYKYDWWNSPPPVIDSDTKKLLQDKNDKAWKDLSKPL